MSSCCGKQSDEQSRTVSRSRRRSPRSKRRSSRGGNVRDSRRSSIESEHEMQPIRQNPGKAHSQERGPISGSSTQASTLTHSSSQRVSASKAKGKQKYVSVGKPPLSYQDAKKIFEENVLYHWTPPELAQSIMLHGFDHSHKPPKQRVVTPLEQPGAAYQLATYESYVKLMDDWAGWSRMGTIQDILNPETDDWDEIQAQYHRDYNEIVVHPEIIEKKRELRRRTEDSWFFSPNRSLHFHRQKDYQNGVTIRVLLPPTMRAKLWTKDKMKELKYGPNENIPVKYVLSKNDTQFPNRGVKAYQSILEEKGYSLSCEEVQYVLDWVDDWDETWRALLNKYKRTGREV